MDKGTFLNNNIKCGQQNPDCGKLQDNDPLSSTNKLQEKREKGTERGRGGKKGEGGGGREGETYKLKET